MKKLIFIGLLTILTSCKAQKIENTKKDTIMLEKFDIEAYNKRKIDPGYEGYYLKDSTHISQFDAGGKGVYKYYIEVVSNPSKLFQEYRVFYYNGNLKLKGLQFSNDFKKGLWKEYDEQGNLIKETDYDAPYKFTWEDILEFIKKRKIDMSTLQFQINRGFDYGNFDESKKDKPFWAITYEDGSEMMKVIILNGINGKVIKEYNEDYPVDD